ncbi:Mitotic checkpoint protein BUB3 [Thelohanellus kitauei]|uniref:Mitotic checkpoint protein BUB3 n=1 Tax=Thelohanellus kitauei TaxID=669202 RepID=A0A0C2JY22_THEKT|nr:Mitotic checkpoint protein BUB3 [Thelohanellus kitauei]
MSTETNTESDLKETLLENCPKDGITSVRFSPYSKFHVLASSWDGTMRYYDVSSNKMDIMFELGFPLLDCDPIDASAFCAASIDQNVYLCYLRDGSFKRLGTHDNAVRCVRYSSSTNSLLSGSWDFTVKGWDLRDHTNSFTVPQENKVYSMSVVDSTLVVATANRKILIWDLRNPRTPVKRDSSLKYQTRKVECFSTKEGYVVASIEGRVAVEFFDLENQSRKFAFKCHRSTGIDGVEIIHPVNGVSFHPVHGTFATGGSDGFVSIWDPFNRKRICQLRRFPNSISSLSFSSDGTMLAIASSYLYEENEKEVDPDSIYIRTLSDTDTKQRPKN